MTLEGGWVVEEMFVPADNATGGNFSVGYIVSHPDHGRAFMKALDYSRTFMSQDGVVALQAMLNDFVFERDMLALCGDKRLDRVVRALATGQAVVEGAQWPAPYLIFEAADGDVRAALDAAADFDTVWVLRVLHHVAVGLQQLHRERIAHQDMKPSNTLIFDGTEGKIADLGCADQQGGVSPRGDYAFAGDPAHAPPELIAGQVAADWATRRQAADLYHLGSLILFLFTGAATTPALHEYLLIDQFPRNWSDPYADLAPYLRNALDQVALDLEATLEGDHAADLVIMFRELCDPDPERRGHPRTRAGGGNPYALDRYVTKLDLLARRAGSAATLLADGPQR
ncbi:MAG: protein kinase [Solirubrobacteraceae bacterium]